MYNCLWQVAELVFEKVITFQILWWCLFNSWYITLSVYTFQCALRNSKIPPRKTANTLSWKGDTTNNCKAGMVTLRGLTGAAHMSHGALIALWNTLLGSAFTWQSGCLRVRLRPCVRFCHCSCFVCYFAELCVCWSVASAS